jgi:isoaspartyl peptidase/L-asparaginase-like protein (Ntn-hydrolase superfamily)
MRSKIMIYDSECGKLDKEAPDYTEKLTAWARESAQSEKAHWDALCEVLYAAHYKMMESCGGYACDHAAVDRLDGAIEMILEAMPDRAKAHFDTLMQRPCER